MQKWAVDVAAQRLGQSLRLDVRVGGVSLTPFFDLRLSDVLAVDAARDTVLDVKALTLDVAFAPLLKGRIDVEELRLERAKLNTKSIIPDVRIAGRVEELSALSRGVEWRREAMHIDRLHLRDSNLDIALSDTAKKDTAKTPVKWVIALDEARIERTAVRVSMPGDSLRVQARLEQAKLQAGHFDLDAQRYRFKDLTAERTAVQLHRPAPQSEIRAQWEKAQLSGADLRLKSPDYRLAHAQLDGGALTMRTPAPAKASAADVDLYDLAFRIDSLHYGSGQRFAAHVRTLGGKERLRRLTLAQANGHVRGDSLGIQLPAFRVNLLGSQLQAKVDLPWSALKPQPSGTMRVELDGALRADEIIAALHGTLPEAQLRDYQALAVRYAGGQPLGVRAKLSGHMGRLSLDALSLDLFRVAQLTASGQLSRVADPSRAGHIAFSLRGPQLQRFEHALPPDLRQLVRLPNGLSAQGVVDFNRSDYRTQMQVAHSAGRLNLTAAVDLETEQYDATVRVKDFPLGHFLKGHPLSPFTGEIGAKGNGFSPTALRSNLVARAKIDRLNYGAYPLSGIALDARMKGRQAVVDFTAANPLIKGSGKVLAHLDKQYAATVDLNLDELALSRLAHLTDTLTVGGRMQGNLAMSPSGKNLSARGHLQQLRLMTPRRGMTLSDVDFDLRSTPDTTAAKIDAGDLHLQLAAAGNLQSISRQAQRIAQLAERQIAARTIDQEALRRALPTLQFHLEAGSDNPLASIARHYSYEFSSVSLHLTGDAQHGLNGHTAVGKLGVGKLLIDTIHGQLQHDSTGINLALNVHNNKRTNPNPFSARLKSYLYDHGLGAELVFADSKGDVGLQLGSRVELAEGGYRVRLYPDEPIVAYRRFKINEDNFIFLGQDRRIQADVRLLADDGTGLMVRSADESTAKNDLSVNIKDLNLGELANVLPYLPKLQGHLNGDFHLVDDGQTLSAMGSLEAKDFAYEQAALGTLGAEIAYLPNSQGEHHVDAFVTHNGAEVAEVAGNYLTTGNGRFEGTARLIDFPLPLLNGFLGESGVAMRGTAQGTLEVNGALSAPRLNGDLHLNDAHIYSKVYGLDFAMDEQPVRLVDSRLTLSDYRLRAATGEALTIGGTVDLTEMQRVRLDLTMKARNFPLINAARSAESLIYGKVWCDYDGTVRGTPDRLLIRGDVDILSKTEATYLLMNSPLSVKDELAELVTFRDFADTIVQPEVVETKGSGFDLVLNVEIQPNAHFNCFLSNNGESYVEVRGDGRLTLRMTQQGEMRLTGRLNLSEGKMNYELPVIPLRTFTLVPGSYVEFKGDPMNPFLSIEANDRVKTIVTEDSRQRAVNFVAGVRISRSLNDMGFEFTIDAPDDLSIKNQLTAMSAEDRGKAAVALLATGMYITDDNLANGGLKASNALNAFLQNEIQNIAGKALSTFDLSFGLESGVGATGEATTDYNFQFSKRFLNDRMRVIIGGKVSTGNAVTNTAESFIDNIALEYRLDQGGSRYVRVYYDRATQDPLEGQLMKAGAGIVLRRRSDTLGELFLFRRKTKTTQP
ncbi:MAG: translocation/assembly module TamB domain-containing protein [Bacteroidaceae bacterium]|nr:translocation/assembly module TamB domain-containing protein [Bacteroidaceae bacterium]